MAYLLNKIAFQCLLLKSVWPNLSWTQLVYKSVAPGVNFINVLCMPFCSKVFGQLFFYLRFGFVTFVANFLFEKRAHKTLMKLTTGDAKSKVECGSFCLVETSLCNVYFYDDLTKRCWLGSMENNLTILTGIQTKSMNGYAETGTSKIITDIKNLCRSYQIYVTIDLYLVSRVETI